MIFCLSIFQFLHTLIFLNICTTVLKQKKSYSSTVTTEGLCHEIRTGWSDRMVLIPGLVEEDLVSTSWVTHPGKNSQCGKQRKEATSHMHITGETKITPNYGTGGMCEHQQPLNPHIKYTSMDCWSLDCKISYHSGNLR